MSLIKEKQNKEINILKDRKLSDSDMVCSSYIDFRIPKYIEIDGIYYATILIINYAREMEPLFLNKLLVLDIDLQLSMYYEKKNSQDVIKELTYNIGNTGATIKTSGENQQDIDILGNTYGDARYIRKQLQVGEEDLFYLTLYVGAYADNLIQLEENLQRIESVAIGNGMTTIRGNYRQEECLKAMLPFLNNNDEIRNITSRNVLTSGLVSTYPFVSNELYDEGGVLVGVNSFDKSLIMLNRFETEKYKNANMFVIGTSRFRKILLHKVND